MGVGGVYARVSQPGVPGPVLTPTRLVPFQLLPSVVRDCRDPVAVVLPPVCAESSCSSARSTIAADAGSRTPTLHRCGGPGPTSSLAVVTGWSLR